MDVEFLQIWVSSLYIDKGRVAMDNFSELIEFRL